MRGGAPEQLLRRWQGSGPVGPLEGVSRQVGPGGAWGTDGVWKRTLRHGSSRDGRNEGINRGVCWSGHAFPLIQFGMVAEPCFPFRCCFSCEVVTLTLQAIQSLECLNPLDKFCLTRNIFQGG